MMMMRKVFINRAGYSVWSKREVVALAVVKGCVLLLSTQMYITVAAVELIVSFIAGASQGVLKK